MTTHVLPCGWEGRLGVVSIIFYNNWQRIAEAPPDLKILEVRTSRAKKMFGENVYMKI